MTSVTVIKRDSAGSETWRYSGSILSRSKEGAVLEARFNRPDLPFHGILLKQGDRFVETFYTDRWYNIFEIHDRDDDHLKGWYCNIGCPAEITPGTVSYVDLELDLLVFPDGRQFVLDEDEFAALELSPEIKEKALAALRQLQAEFRADLRMKASP